MLNKMMYNRFKGEVRYRKEGVNGGVDMYSE